MEIPSPKSGVVKSISIKLGDQVSEGDEILLLEVEGGSASAEEAPAEKPASEPAAADVAAKQDQASEEPLKGEQEGDGQAGESSIETIEVPDLGDDRDVEVIEVNVKIGDVISAEDSLITLESDKAAMEIPSPKAGEVKSVNIKVGDKVSMGAAI